MWHLSCEQEEQERVTCSWEWFYISPVQGSSVDFHILPSCPVIFRPHAHPQRSPSTPHPENLLPGFSCSSSPVPLEKSHSAIPNATLLGNLHQFTPQFPDPQNQSLFPLWAAECILYTAHHYTGSCMIVCSRDWIMNPRKARTGLILFEEGLAKIAICEINGRSFWWLLYRIYAYFMSFRAIMYLHETAFTFLPYFTQYYSNCRFQTH